LGQGDRGRRDECREEEGQYAEQKAPEEQEQQRDISMKTGTSGITVPSRVLTNPPDVAIVTAVVVL
jgi:hypothetical protein